MEHHAYIILGAGPAGLQLGHFLQSQDYLILERGTQVGQFFAEMPRHRTLISINKVHTGFTDRDLNLRWDWNSLLSDNGPQFPEYSKAYFPHADHMLDYLRDYAQSQELKIRFNTEIVEISRLGQGYCLRDAQGQSWSCDALIVATGLYTPNTPVIPGIEHSVSYRDMSVDAQDFSNQRVLIIGKGNSAFETANHLLAHASAIHLASPEPVTPAWHSRYVGHMRSINAVFLDSYLLKSQNALLNADIESIVPHPDGGYDVTFAYRHAEGEREELHYDQVLNCTGFRFNPEIFAADCQPELTANGKFPRMHSQWESSNLLNLYFAGVLMHMRDYKQKQSGFIHGFRYNIRFLSQYLQRRYQGQEIPHQRFSLMEDELMDTIVERMNQSSALWQQTGYLVDAIELDTKERQCRYYQELPIDYIRPLWEQEDKHFFLLSLEFTPLPADADPLNLPRPHRENHAAAEQSSFIHPVLRHYHGSELLSEHHVIEDLEGQWLEPEHLRPLGHYLRSTLHGIHLSGKLAL